MSEPLKRAVLSRNALSIGDMVETVDKEVKSGNNGIGFTDVGHPVTGCRVKIVDAGGNRLEENHLGRIFIKGKNVTRTYYNDDGSIRSITERFYVSAINRGGGDVRAEATQIGLHEELTQYSWKTISPPAFVRNFSCFQTPNKPLWFASS